MPAWLEPFTESWQANLLWAVIGGIIFAVPVSLIINKLTRERQVLEYRIISTTLITEEMAQIPGIQITMDGAPVKNLVSTTIRFQNSGSQSIEENDFRKAAPLGLQVKDGVFFGGEHGYSIETIHPNIVPEVPFLDDKNVILAFDSMKSGESFSITIFHSGKASVCGDLRKGSIKEYDPKTYRIIGAVCQTIFSVVLAVVLAFLETVGMINFKFIFIGVVLFFIATLILLIRVRIRILFKL